MRVIVTGSRSWFCPALAELVVARLVARYGPALVIVHGGATGVDQAFAEHATSTDIVPSDDDREFEVPFYQGFVMAKNHAGHRWVSVKRICENMKVNFTGQQNKLKSASWATTEIISVVGKDGKRRDSLMLRLDCLAKWIEGIELSKVPKSAWPAVKYYQDEAVQLLAAYFGGGAKDFDYGKYNRVHAAAVNAQSPTRRPRA